MGWLDNSRIKEISTEAKNAKERGDRVFTTCFEVSWGGDDGRGSLWGRMIEAIEAEGWRLDQWAVSSKGAYPLFRR